MLFKVTNRSPSVWSADPDTVFLKWDNWNDFSYYTLYHVSYKDHESVIHELGSVRIGYFGQGEGLSNKQPEQGKEFKTIDSEFFSLGAGTSYYEAIKELSSETRKNILKGLRDIAFLPDVLQEVKDQPVTQISLMRGIDIETVRGQYKRMAHGGAKLTKFNFWFDSPKINDESPAMELSFEIIPESNPPTNVHVIIGRNGVGKTNMINNMIGNLFDGDKSKGNVYFRREDERFINVVSVSFSAFDTNKPHFDNVSPSSGIKFKYIGLKKPDTEGRTEFKIKTGDELAEEFITSFIECIQTFKSDSLSKCLTALESDPNFEEADIRQLLEFKQKNITSEGVKLFNRLSSGHKIILLSITRLVEAIQEKSLVFIDEPEAHLHPPLLSAFTRALSELLTNINGVAIVATHSPVILQEVPKECVYKLHRIGSNAFAQRPEIETFGENVGVLTREVFTLEVTDSGFYQLLKKAVEETANYEMLLKYFDEKLGMEARSLARVLFANKNRG